VRSLVLKLNGVSGRHDTLAYLRSQPPEYARLIVRGLFSVESIEYWLVWYFALKRSKTIHQIATEFRMTDDYAKEKYIYALDKLTPYIAISEMAH
jgi:hypothetical protein